MIHYDLWTYDREENEKYYWSNYFSIAGFSSPAKEVHGHGYRN